MKFINLIASPRNISTALMYSFAQRADTHAIDEPYYAHYLMHSHAAHPGREEILAAMEKDVEKIYTQIFSCADHPVVFVKNMGHHIAHLPLDSFQDFTPVFLIRHPWASIRSCSKVLPSLGLEDLGLVFQWKYCEYLLSRGVSPIVISAEYIRENPVRALRALCASLNIQFDENMLSWPEGPKPQDGIWSKFWYKNVHKSTGFKPLVDSASEYTGGLDKQYLALYEKAMPYYKKLSLYSLNVQ